MQREREGGVSGGVTKGEVGDLRTPHTQLLKKVSTTNANQLTRFGRSQINMEGINVMENIVIGSVAGIVVFVLSAIVTHYSRKYWFIQPKLVMQHSEESASSGGLVNSRLILQWRGKLDIYNSTKHDALNVELLWPDGRPTFPLSPLEEQHIKALDTVSLNYVVKRVVPLEASESGANKLSESYPDELRRFVLILQYTNEMNKRFYTKYTKDGMKQSCTFHRSPPI